MSNFYTIYTENPKGVKNIEQDGKALEAFAFPRDFLSEFGKFEEAKKPGVYILYNTADKNETPIVYIGQSGSNEGVYSRLYSHNKHKNFWNYAICFVTKDDSFEMTHAKYIESKLISSAIECEIVDLDNATGSDTPPTNKHTKHLCDMWTKEIIDMVNMLGLPFFNKIKQYGPTRTDNVFIETTSAKEIQTLPKESIKEDIEEKIDEQELTDLSLLTLEPVFYFSRYKKEEKRTIKGKMIVKNGKYIVLKDSDIAETDDNCHGKNIRNKYFEEYGYSKTLKIDIECKSPSGAGEVLFGGTCDGWTRWKDENGKILGSYVKRNKKKRTSKKPTNKED